MDVMAVPGRAFYLLVRFIERFLVRPNGKSRNRTEQAEKWEHLAIFQAWRLWHEP